MKFHDTSQHYWRVIGLGFALTFLSSFGQTFFISLSGPDIRAAFGLTHGAFGSIYSLATLSSGLLMIWVGSVIDRVDIRLYATTAMLGLAIGRHQPLLRAQPPRAGPEPLRPAPLRPGHAQPCGRHEHRAPA